MSIWLIIRIFYLLIFKIYFYFYFIAVAVEWIMSRKRKFYKISKELRIQMIRVQCNHCLLQIKEQKEWKNENGKMTQKLFMNLAEERTLLFLNLNFKGAINTSLAKKVKVMKRLLILQ